MSQTKDNLTMFILDVVRHGGGSTLQGILKRLNDFNSIGWRDKNGKPFTKEVVDLKVSELINDGLLLVEDLNANGKVLSIFEVAKVKLNDSYLITNSNKSLAELAKWKPPTSSI